MADPLLMAGAGVFLFVVGTLFGMALERSASGNLDDSDEDLTDWERDQ